MRSIIFAFLILVCIGVVFASLEVEVTLSDRFALETFTYSGEPGIVSFELPTEPVSVTSEVPYVLNGSIVAFNASDTPLSFSALFDDLIISSGSDRIFRSSISSDEVALTVILPKGATLEESVPQGTLLTDGSRIAITWPASSEVSVAVFYTIEESFSWILVLAFVLPIIAAFVVFLIWRTKSRTIDALISADERLVLERVDGTRTQKEIANELVFSKSKMSKVVRKLEEKGLVGKEPHFKTNRLRRR
jgi:hypothetical protein